jgi:acyl-CoA thioester hydrolase
MIEHAYAFRVAYPDTDKMGTVHHSNYAKYYETARWELLRSIGMPYQILEQMGYMLPVISMSFKFRKTTRYDEQLTVRTTLKEIRGARIWFTYKLYNESSELINEAETELAFVMEGSWKPCPTPDFFKAIIDSHSKKVMTQIAN